MFLSECRKFTLALCLAGKKKERKKERNLKTAHISMLLKLRA
jgi:hypothetical protein